MIYYYAKTAFRNILKSKIYSVINIIGLSIGIACCILIFLFVHKELNYDTKFKNADRIYRIKLVGDMADNHFEAAVCGAPMTNHMKDEIIDVIENTRLVNMSRSILFTYENSKIYQKGIIYADSNFFDIFDYEFVYGEPHSCLDNPNSLVLMKSVADKFFRGKDPVGENISTNNKNYTITAVIEDPDFDTHLTFKGLISLSTLRSHPRYGPYLRTPFAFIASSYVVLNKNNDAAGTQKKIDEITRKYMGDQMQQSGANFRLELQPIKRIHLHSDLLHEMGQKGDINKVYIFSAIAILILIIAIINFINLTTARSNSRALEVGIRKVYGATKGKLIRQFLSETFIITLISIILSFALVEMFFPVVNNLTGGELVYNRMNIIHILVLIISLILFAGILSGLYPAMVLSAFKPIKVLKGDTITGSRKPLFRNAMVIFQFLITIILICSTLIVYKQLDFMKKKDIGYNPDNMLIVTLRDNKSRSQFETIMKEFGNISSVKNISASAAYPGNYEMRRSFLPEGMPRNNMWMVVFNDVYYNYPEMMELQFKAGRNFSPTYQADSMSVIVNEAFVKEAGWGNPLGKHIIIPADSVINDVRYKIIGVVKDFNYASLHQTVKPLILKQDNNNQRYIAVRLTGKDDKKAVKLLTAKWEELYPGTPFEYFFLDNSLKGMYRVENTTGGLFSYFTYLAILIACLGLLGLVTFITEQRKREIGIKKVLGSSIMQIVNSLLVKFLKLIIIAAALAVPVAWYVMNLWLEDYPYRTRLDWWVFSLAIFAALIIAMVTVGSIAYRAATRNPVDTIRYE